ncbi:phosphoglucosamine mutase [Phycicoccus endophyticus]|uniref:Phosphoglucosamine mutase n=1 Tax=Phycicoccus endophyticus TaxID=1690220 RepID=A0A7G9QZ42_9MICO|nr:phosphoglucosamine mutase [Phycicoccus endophyticus]NHI18962.1 phosphoglucosamine mutase [Phycicoccus endophyticus]QNN48617.1 phosphoglucosamine mutase [Phycicoccus endophyticus]GGL31710.1 phosphoglucosamine mutase [Phycicoccus endophyticus]
MSRLFGTDGVRGLANREITAELALDLSIAAAHVLGEEDRRAGRRPRAVVGRDPRASGELLSAAVCAGLASAGVDVHNVGVLPTPAVAFLTADMGATFGVVLSASHNAMPDNGIKFFAAGGHKLADAVEDEIAERMGQDWERPQGAAVGRIHENRAGQARYVAHLLSALPNRLDGLSVVIDAAHGAASAVSPEVFRLSGAEVVEIGADPDGLNINDGYGSTHLERLQAAVLERGADLGIAHDGDADRCLAVDAEGGVVDGDQIMAVLALALRDHGLLRENTLVATVMSNLGLLQAMDREGISVKQTAVGDRYVLEEMRRHEHSLGGEQSGHVIILEHATTGDGVLTGLMLAARVAETGRPLGELAGVVTRLPQVLVNVKGVDKSRVESDEVLQAAVRAEAAALGGSGRVLLRKSGTEPVVRVMVEAATEQTARDVCDRLCAVLQQRLAL